MEAEVRFHLESYAADLVRNGVPEQEAMRRARVEFGGIESHKDAVRASLGLRAWNELLTDLRHTVRMMRRNPGFTTVTVLLLALGIGANTAIFSLVYTLMLRRLPVQDPEQLVELLHRYPGEPHLNGFSWQAYRLLRDHNHVFSGLVAAAYQPFHVHGGGLEPQSVEGGFVDGSFFPVLGIKPALGRLIGPNDDRMGNPSAVAVVSWSCWKNKFNLDPAILGKQIIVEDVPGMVIGVTPRQFSGLQVEASQDVWLPLAMEQIIHHPSYTSTAGGWVYLVGRRKPGVSVEQVRAEMAVLYHSTLEEQAQATNNPFLRQMKLEVEPAGAGLSSLREEWTKPLLLLMAVVGMQLLIACSNLASMLLARGAAREHEMALRVSLGAGRFRLARQMLTESLLLSATGGLFGVFVAYFGAGALARIITAERRPGPPIEFHVQIDVHVLLFTATVALLAGLLFGLVPALRAMRTAPASSLRQRSSGETRRRRLFGKSLVVLDVEALRSVITPGSIFDPSYKHRLERAEFLKWLSRRITMPVMPDDEPFEYLATQAVADFLSSSTNPLLY